MDHNPAWKRIKKFDSDFTPCGCFKSYGKRSDADSVDHTRHTPVLWRAVGMHTDAHWYFRCEACAALWRAPICTSNGRPGGVTPDHDYRIEVLSSAKPSSENTGNDAGKATAGDI